MGRSSDGPKHIHPSQLRYPYRTMREAKDMLAEKTQFRKGVKLIREQLLANHPRLEERRAELDAAGYSPKEILEMLFREAEEVAAKKAILMKAVRLRQD